MLLGCAKYNLDGLQAAMRGQEFVLAPLIVVVRLAGRHHFPSICRTRCSSAAPPRAVTAVAAARIGARSWTTEALCRAQTAAGNIQGPLYFI